MMAELAKTTLHILTPIQVWHYNYEMTESSTKWELAIKSVLGPGHFEEMYFLGPTGLPIASSVYVVYRTRNQKRRGDQRLRDSGLGDFCDEDPMKAGPHVTWFLRPQVDWQVEMPTEGRA
jgi:hypothetical protein